MGYPTIGAEGSITSWGSANFYSRLLARIKAHQAVLRVQGDAKEVAGLDDDFLTHIPGLKQWSVSLRSRWNSTPKLGNVGLLAFSAGGYTQHIQRYEVTFGGDALPYTPLLGPSSARVWRDWRPGRFYWRGTFDAIQDSGTAVVNPPDPTAALPTLTMTYGDESVDDTLAGSVVLTPLDIDLNLSGELTTVRYGFEGSGQLASSGTTRAFDTAGSGTGPDNLAPIVWSQAGSAVGALVFATLTGTRTFSGVDSFLKEATVRVAVDEPVEIDLEIQGTGAMVPA